MNSLHDTYNTKTEADTFVRTFNIVNGNGRSMFVHFVCPGVYQVWERA